MFACVYVWDNEKQTNPRRSDGHKEQHLCDVHFYLRTSWRRQRNIKAYVAQNLLAQLLYGLCWLYVMGHESIRIMIWLVKILFNFFLQINGCQKERVIRDRKLSFKVSCLSFLSAVKHIFFLSMLNQFWREL